MYVGGRTHLLVVVVTLAASACGAERVAGPESAVPTRPAPAATAERVAAGITVSPSSVMLLASQRHALAATVTDSLGAPIPGREISWTTSAPAVAAVARGGTVSAMAAGVTVVRAAHGEFVDSAIIAVVPDSAIVVSAGRGHSCAATASGRAFCWGANDHGQLGDGTLTDAVTPVLVLGTEPFRTVAAGTGFTCGVGWSGQAYCWGDNSMRELGNAVGKVSLVPAPVRSTAGFASVSASDMSHACALDTASTGYCWGYNRWGQVGNGSTADERFPRVILGGLAFQQLQANAMRTCGVTVEADVYCWGRNDHLQLANDTTQLDVCSGTLGCVTTPRRAQSSQHYYAVAPGRAHTCAITEDHRLHCWGANEDGQLGIGSNVAVASPTPVGAGIRFTQASASSRHTCASAEDGTAYCWGFNGDGRLGVGAAVLTANAPTTLAGNRRFTSVSTGHTHSCGISDGGVLCWGANGRGQLGAGDRANGATPREVVLDLGG